MKLKLIALLFAAFLLTGCEAGRMIYDMLNVREEATETADETEIAKIEPAVAVTAERQSAAGYGGGLSLSMRLPMTLNPVLNEDVTVGHILTLIFEPLLSIDEHQRAVPNLAGSVYLTSGALSAVVTLRNDIYWNDGTPVTTRDVAFTIDELKKAPEEAIYARCAGSIRDYARIDDKEMRIDFYDSAAANLYGLAFPVIPEHYYRGAMSFDNDKNMRPLGGGAYVFDSYKPATELKLKANDRYFKREAYISEITVVVSSDRETDNHAFEQGLIDAAEAGLAEQGRYSGKKQVRTTEYVSTYFDFIGFNHKSALFEDARMRGAAARCVDADYILSEIYSNGAQKAATCVNPVSWLYAESIRPYPTDLAEAGFVFDWRPFPDDLGAVILVNEENPERVAVAEHLCGNLNAAGLPAAVEKTDFDTFMERVREADFDIVVAGMRLSVAPEYDLLLRSDENPFLCNDDIMDKLLEEFAAASTELSIKDAADRIQRRVVEETLLIGVGFKKEALLTDTRINGEILPTTTNPYYNIREWHIY